MNGIETVDGPSGKYVLPSEYFSYHFLKHWSGVSLSPSSYVSLHFVKVTVQIFLHSSSIVVDISHQGDASAYSELLDDIPEYTMPWFGMEPLDNRTLWEQSQSHSLLGRTYPLLHNHKEGDKWECKNMIISTWERWQQQAGLRCIQSHVHTHSKWSCFVKQDPEG